MKKPETYIPISNALDLISQIIRSHTGATALTVKQSEQMAAAAVKKYAACMLRANRIKA